MRSGVAPSRRLRDGRIVHSYCHIFGARRGAYALSRSPTAFRAKQRCVRPSESGPRGAQREAARARRRMPCGTLARAQPGESCCDTHRWPGEHGACRQPPGRPEPKARTPGRPSTRHAGGAAGAPLQPTTTRASASSPDRDSGSSAKPNTSWSDTSITIAKPNYSDLVSGATGSLSRLRS